MAKVKGTTTAVAKGKEVADVTELKVLSPEEYQASIEDRVKTEIQKFGVVDKAVATLKEKHKDVVVPEVGDKKGKAVLKEAYDEVNSIIRRIEEKRVFLKEQYLKTGQGIDNEAKRLTAMLKEVFEPLKQKKDELTRLENEEKERKIREEEEKLKNRVQEIKDAGMTFDGNFYVLGSGMSMDVVTIKQMKDGDFAFFVQKVKIEAERIRKVQEEEDRIKAEQEEKERAEREELKRQQDELKAEQTKIAMERLEFQKKQEEFEALQKKALEDEEKRKKEIAQQIINERQKTLVGNGFVFIPTTQLFVFRNEGGEHTIAAALLASSPEHWAQTVMEAQKKVEEIQLNARQIAKDKEEQQRKEAVEAEEKKRIQLEKLAKIEREQAEAEEAERIAALPDFEKAVAYFQLIKGITLPDVKDVEVVEFFKIFTGSLDEMIGLIQEEISKKQKPAGE